VDRAVPTYDRPEGRAGLRRSIVFGVVGLVLGVAGGFLAGRAAAPDRPATLAEAVQMAARGELPRGTFQGGGPFGQRFGNGQGRDGGQGQSGGPQIFDGAPGGAGPGGVQGSITAIDGDVVTVQTRAGTIRVRLGAGTSVLKTAPGSKADLAVGRDVQVRLDLGAGGGADGTVSAQSITVEPVR
jgi:hypothetical protein